MENDKTKKKIGLVQLFLLQLILIGGIAYLGFKRNSKREMYSGVLLLLLGIAMLMFPTTFTWLCPFYCYQDYGMPIVLDFEDTCSACTVKIATIAARNLSWLYIAVRLLLTFIKKEAEIKII